MAGRDRAGRRATVTSAVRARWPHYAMRRAWVKHIAHELWMRQREPAAAREPGAAVLFERSYEAFGA